jgi:hypothetical protein
MSRWLHVTLNKWRYRWSKAAGALAAASSCQDRAQVHPCSCFGNHRPWWIDDPDKNFRRQLRHQPQWRAFSR